MLEYYQVVLQDLIDTGRVRFFPESSYFNKMIRSATGKVWSVKARKIVWANCGEVPSKSPMPLPCLQGAGVNVCSPDDPAVLSHAPEYLVVGAGKSAVEALLWLLKKGIDPETITWVLPHESYWLQERVPPATPSGKVRTVQPQAQSSKFQCAALSNQELKDLGLVTNIVRLGLVMGAEPGRLLFERGEVPLQTGSVVLDCSESLQDHKEVPIWQPGKLVLQCLSNCKRAKSSALIAAIELQPGTDEEKNLFKPARSVPKVERKVEDSPVAQLFRTLPRPAPPPLRGSLPLPPPPPKAAPPKTTLEQLLFQDIGYPSSPKNNPAPLKR